MKMHLAVRLSVLILLSISSHGLLADGLEPMEVFRYERILGTSFELKVAGATHDQATLAEQAALAEIDRLAKILSSYDATSEVSRWQRTQGVAVLISKELSDVLGLFDHWRGLTGGALDPAAAAINKIWRDAEKQQQLPSLPMTERAVATIRRPHWQLDTATLHATHLSDTPLVFNSLTKSFIIQRAAEAAMAAGHPKGLVLNIGGDLVVCGKLEERVAIANPQADAENDRPIDTLLVSNRAVATSGNYRRGWEIQGKHYSHIVDPRTGRTAEEILSATVVAPDATDAGALATALCVLKPEESARLVAATSGAEYLLVTRDGRRLSSPGWDRLKRPAVQLAANGELHGLFAAATPVPAAPATAAGNATAWDSSMELVIQLELAQVDDPRYRRPYVAVWIEDKDKFPVRTLALWFQKPKWLPDLKMWHHADQLRALADGTDLTASVSSATRSAGKYTLKWDGKDDKGVLIRPGKYTVCIEAAREHGTYQLIRKEMDFSGTPAQASLPGNQEIAGAALEYRRKVAR